MRPPTSRFRAAVAVVACGAALTMACTADETPSSSTEAPATEGSTTGGANTASARGVTADTIRVGVVVPDFDALRAVNIPTLYGDAEVVYQAFFDQINEAGGIGGRMIEPFYADFSYVDIASQDAACVELTEDREVFIVFGGLLSDNNLCFTELHDTMVMTSIFQTEELRERSGDTLWLATAAVDEAYIEALAHAVAESGQLDGKTIGIVALGSVADGAAGEEMQEVLADLGYADSQVAVVTAPNDDRAAVDQELAVITQRFIADGVDFVFSLTEGPSVYEPFAAADYHPTVVDRSLGSSTVALQDTSLLDGVLGVGAIPAHEVWGDPEFTETCSDVVLDANPELGDEFDRQVPTSEEMGDGLPNWYITISAACNQTRLFQQLAEIAGADLTNDTFRAALDELGPVELFTYGAASFRSDDKWDGQDEFQLLEWNEDEQRLESVADPIVLDR